MERTWWPNGQQTMSADGFQVWELAEVGITKEFKYDSR